MNITLIQGDITTIEVDAIVNTANSALAGGGGVDGAIHRAGGPEILAECRRIIAKIGSCPAGSVVKTGAGRLKARYVFHTVGPVWHGGMHNERKTLARCYEASLDLAQESACASIAFPAISTGVYGFPKEEAVAVVRSVMEKYMARGLSLSVIFVNLDRGNHLLYQKAFSDLSGSGI